MLSFLTDSLASLIYPQFCGVCGRLVEKSSDGAACAECWSNTKIFGDLDRLCQKCGLFLVESDVETTNACGQCSDHAYDTAQSSGVYGNALAASILHLKRVPLMPVRIKELLVRTLDRAQLTGDYLIVPVPLSKKRLIERGFNQSSLLGKVLSAHTGWKFDEHSLIRTGDTPMHRAAMDRFAREATVKKAFSVVRPGLIKGKDILLVDDLFTSGATASNCSKVMKKVGAERVVVLTLARAA